MPVAVRKHHSYFTAAAIIQTWPIVERQFHQTHDKGIYSGNEASPRVQPISNQGKQPSSRSGYVHSYREFIRLNHILLVRELDSFSR